MSPLLILGVLIGYFLLLFTISQITSRNADNADFFIGSKESPWYLVAFGMIGASLSGVTFISVPGWVAGSSFAYMQMVLGYLVGYTFIALVLMPLYYRLNLTSIYTYLEQRFGTASYKTGAGFFLLSRTIGAAFRLYLVAGVLQYFVFDAYGIPFIVTVVLTILLIWLYTFKGGIRTIVWTDSLQTFFMLLSVILSIFFIAKGMNLSIGEVVATVQNSDYSQIFFFEDFMGNKNHFVKQFLSGAMIAVVMTGLDQDMMQKNLSCRNIGDAQKNMFTMSLSLIFVNLLFLGLGALLYIYAAHLGVEPSKADHLFPLIALEHLPIYAGIIFLLGLIAAAYSSADSALTSLTTSFCVDFLDFEKHPEKASQSTRFGVHIGFSVILAIVIWLFSQIGDDSVIVNIFKAAGYTYGPLLGLYAFGLFTNLKIKDNLAPLICIISPIICFYLNKYSATLLGGYQFGFELLILNGLLTFAGLLLISNGTQTTKTT